MYRAFTSRPVLARSGLTLGLVAASFLAAACTSPNENADTGPQIMLTPRVTITSVAGDLESQLYAAIYAQVLEDNGVKVVRLAPVRMTRSEYMAAIERDDFQMIPEYTRPLLHDLLETTGTDTSTTTPTSEQVTATTRAPITIPTTTLPTSTTVGSATTAVDGSSTTVGTVDTGTTTTVAAAPETTIASTSSSVSTSTVVIEETTTTSIPPTNPYSLAAQITLINDALPKALIVYSSAFAEHRTVVACTKSYLARTSQYALYSLTDLASLAPQTRFAASAAFYADDSEGMGAMRRTYAPEFAAELTLEGDELAAAIDDDSVDCVAVDSLDPVVASKGLMVIYDDQFMTPTNTAIVLMKATVNLPEVTAALDKLTIALTTTRLNQMMREIQENGTPVEVVANAFVGGLNA